MFWEWGLLEDFEALVERSGVMECGCNALQVG